MALSPIQLQQAVEHGRHALGGLIHGLEEAARFLQVFGTGAGGLQQLGIAREEIICIGDNFNDRDMLEYAGLGIAMGNAPAEVQACADVVTAGNDEDGVARAIEKYYFGK